MWRVEDGVSSTFESEGPCPLRTGGCVYRDSEKSSYQFRVGDPYAFNNMLKEMSIVASSQDPVEQPYTLSMKWYVPVTGDVKKSKYPKSITAPTANNLIFMVLRDPPGGGSSSSWGEDNSFGMNFGISNDGGNDHTLSTEHSLS